MDHLAGASQCLCDRRRDGLPISKAGSVAHYRGDVLCDNVGRFPRRAAASRRLYGLVNSFIEISFGKALLIDLSYDTEPLAGSKTGGLLTDSSNVRSSQSCRAHVLTLTPGCQP